MSHVIGGYWYEGYDEDRNVWMAELGSATFNQGKAIR